MSELVHQERPADGAAAGLVILHHGRGADEHDLIGLADVLDPGRRLHFVTPGGPLRLPGWPGRHWYQVPQVGFPNPETFHASYAALTAFHDELWERTGLGPQNTVLGGFSMGSVMSYATGLGEGRPRVRGLLIFSGFIPTVTGWSADLAGTQQAGTRVFIAHGSNDPVIDVSFARQANALLDDAGIEHEYHESAAAHHIDPAQIPAAVSWLGDTLR